MGWILFIAMIVLLIVVLCIKDVSTNTPPASTATPSELNGSSMFQEEIKKTFLSQNSAFSDLIVSNVLSERNKGNPWVISMEKATETRTRTVFIGYHDMYVFRGTPYIGSGRIEDNYPYPITFYVMNGGETIVRHTYQNISYANHLGYASIDDYHGVPKRQVITWIAEDIRTKFQSLHPEMQVSAVKYAKEDPSYYYFTYEVPAIQLSGWK